MWIVNCLRKRKLGKFASPVKTALMPLDDIKTVNILLDVDEFGFNELNDAVIEWGRKHTFKLTVYYFDFRKLGKHEMLLTNIKTTILRKDLSLTGTPPVDKLMTLFGEESDLFISMVNNSKFPVEFVSKCAKAHFKVGRKGFEGDAYDIVVSKNDTPDNIDKDSCSVFNAITELLSKVK